MRAGASESTQFTTSQLANQLRVHCRRALPWLMVGLTPLLVYHQVYWPFDDSRSHFWGDTTGAYWPDLAFFTRSLQKWQLPLWNPDDRGGFPFAFDPQPGVLYPLNWIFVILALLWGQFPYELLQWKIFAHLSITAFGWYAWLASRSSKPAAMVGAIAATFGCFTLQHVHFGLVWPIAFVPWFLVALDRWLATRSTSAALCVASSLGAIVAAGSPPSTLYGLIVCACYGILPVARSVYGLKGTDRFRLLVTGVLGVAVAALLSAPVIVGTAHLTASSVLEKRSFDTYVNFGRLDPEDLFALVYPTTSGSLLYVGVTIAGLALLGLCLHLRNSLVWLSTGLALLGVLLTIGDHTPVLRWASIVMPPVRFFRLPFRYLYLTQVATGVLAASGTDALLTSKRMRRWIAHGLLLVLLVASAALWREPPQLPRSKLDLLTNDMAAATLWLGLILFVCLIAKVRHTFRYVAYALPLLVAADLANFVPHTHVLRKGIFELPRLVSASATAKMMRESDQYRVWDEFGLGFRSGSRLGLRDLRGYMDPLRLADYETMLTQLARAPELLERWGVRWVLSAPHAYVGTSHNRVHVSGLGFGTKREAHLIELPQPRSAAFFTNHVEIAQTNAAAFQALLGNPLTARVQVPADAMPPGADGLSQLARSDSPVGPDVSATLLQRRNNSLKFKVDAPNLGWFVVNEAYFPGWSASVDGRSVSVQKVDGWIRGFPLSPGLHTIEMLFRPWDWLVLASIAFIAWLALGGWALWAAYRRLAKSAANL
jgi:hypothetical protein